MAYMLYPDLGLFILRLGLAVIFLYHAYPKLTKAKDMAKMMGWKSEQILLLGVVELVGALSVLFGIYVQVGALLLSLVMLGAIWYKIMKWKVPFSAMDKMGWEFDLILLAGSLLVFLTGAGAFAFLP